MANVITPQSGILDVNGQIRQNGNPVVTQNQLSDLNNQILAINRCAVYAASNISGSTSPKVVSIDNTNPAYDVPSNLVKVKVLSSLSEEIIGIAVDDISIGNIGTLITRGIVNSTLNGSYIGQPVYSDVFGEFSTTVSEKIVGYVISTGPNAKVFVDVRAENYTYWQQQIAASVVVPPGTMIQFAGNTPPSGYLACDGQSYAVASYPNLHAAIGYTYGGSGPNFNVPDCRGLVMVGSGQHGTMTRANGTPYNGGSVGATRNDQFQNFQIGGTRNGTTYYGSLEFQSQSYSIVPTPPIYGVITYTTLYQGLLEAARPLNTGTHGDPRVGDETRPAEIAVLVCIKY
jgi:hypothetical protein